METTLIESPTGTAPGGTRPVQARMANPALALPGAMPALLALGAAVQDAGVPARTLELVHLRASQINGCGVCSVQHQRLAKRAGETDERLWSISGWRDAPRFDDAERAALALAECVTRLADRGEAVPDEVFEEAARHYDEPQLAALLMSVALVNLWNRVNTATRQVAGQQW
jgi:AhpD family alkylhydroperoxidase